MDAYSKISKLYEIKNITTEEFMYKIDMLQAIFGRVRESGWCDMERIKADADIQFTSKEFQESLYVGGVRLSLAASDHH